MGEKIATDPNPTPAEVAHYIARMLGSHEELAGESKLQMVAYLVGIAKEEVEVRAKKSSTGGAQYAAREP